MVHNFMAGRENIVIHLDTNKPTLPGTYFLKLPNRNTRLADVCLVAGDLMVYCNDVGVHGWLDKLPDDYQWCGPITINGDHRKH